MHMVNWPWRRKKKKSDFRYAADEGGRDEKERQEREKEPDTGSGEDWDAPEGNGAEPEPLDEKEVFDEKERGWKSLRIVIRGINEGKGVFRDADKFGDIIFKELQDHKGDFELSVNSRYGPGEWVPNWSEKGMMDLVDEYVIEVSYNPDKPEFGYPQVSKLLEPFSKKDKEFPYLSYYLLKKKD